MAKGGRLMGRDGKEEFVGMGTGERRGPSGIWVPLVGFGLDRHPLALWGAVLQFPSILTAVRN